MDQLPYEIIDQICRNLQWSPHSSQKDLVSLGRANWILHEATIPVPYQNIVLKFSDPRSLQSAVSDIMEGPQRHYFLKYARRLHIVCCSYRGYRQKLATWEVDMMNEEDFTPTTRALAVGVTSFTPGVASVADVTDDGWPY